jgi:hypothetical protein
VPGAVVPGVVAGVVDVGVVAVGVVDVEPPPPAGAVAPPVGGSACAEAALSASAITAIARLRNIRVEEVIRKLPGRGPPR